MPGLLALRKQCTARGILLPKKISKGGIIGLLKCETLLIGIEPERVGLQSVRVISTQTTSENLKWTSLTVKKGIPNETFSQIYIGNPCLFLTDDGDVSPRPYHAISRVLKKNGLLYLVESYLGGLVERLGRDFKFIEFYSTSTVTFAVYARRGESEGHLPEGHLPEGHLPEGHLSEGRLLEDVCLRLSPKQPGKYQLVDLNSKDPSDPSGPSGSPSGLHITLSEFIEEVGRTEFINQFASSVRSLLVYKKEFYLKKKGDVKKKFDVLQRRPIADSCILTLTALIYHLLFNE